jgi:hypothetical protein
MEWMAAPAPNVLLPVADDRKRERHQSAGTENGDERPRQRLEWS